MKKLKIGIITHNFPASLSERKNAGIFVYDFAKELSKKANVVVFCPGPKDSIKNISNIKVYFFKSTLKLGSLKSSNPWDILKFLNFLYSANKTFKKYLNDNKDLNFSIAMWAFPSGIFSNLLFKKLGIPYAIYCLGSDIYVYSKIPILKFFIRKYLNNASVLLADSPDLASKTQQLTKKTVNFLPSASNFDFKIKRQQSKKNTYTYLGRMEKIKGVDLLIESIKHIGKSDMFFNFIGDGSLLEKAKKELQDYKNAKFFGNINDKKVIAEIINKSDWVIIPSRSDSIPLVFSEAMKSKTPVICSDLPDFKYLIKNYNVGVLFNSGSVKSLVGAITKTQNETSLKYKDNLKKAADIFNLSKSSDKLLALIKNEIKN